jgi:CHAT domain-containing protein
MHSALLLSDGSALSLADVLGQDRMPREVVLSACESAVTGAKGVAVGLGLAQAFLLRGTASVVATSEPVDDRVARAFAHAFYGQDASVSVELRLQRALLSLREQGVAWEGYRLLVP